MACGSTEKDESENVDRILIMVENFEKSNFSSTNPFVGESDNAKSYNDLLNKNSVIASNSASSIMQQANPFLKEMETTGTPVHLFQGENEELPEIDNSLFEVEEPELIHFFEIPPLLKNPFAQDCLKNPFTDDFVSNSHKIFRKNINPFEVLLKDDANLCTGISEEIRVSKLDSSEWHQHDKFFQKVLSSKLR